MRIESMFFIKCTVLSNEVNSFALNMLTFLYGNSDDAKKQKKNNFFEHVHRYSINNNEVKLKGPWLPYHCLVTW
jgi:hypothetical protein